MRYVVYDKKSGQIIRTYRKMMAESGELLPASDEEILSGLPAGSARENVAYLSMREFPFARGKTYKVDVHARTIVEVPVKATKKTGPS